ncbi:MAG: serine hydrolase [Bacteroidetes bacterium]|nr:serine hydrolase [Bacteroidota bacterium]
MKVFYKILTFVVLLLIVTWFLMPRYLRKALIYQKPGIEDYTIFANRKVKIGTPIPWALAKDYNKVKISDTCLAHINEFGTVAFLVLKNDSILHEEYWDGYSDTSYSNSFSMAKSFVSLMIGCLVDEGKIKSLDQPITDFIDAYTLPEYTHITIKDLLTMSSGLKWDEAYSSAFSVTTQAYYGNDLPKLMASLRLAEEPGKIHRYKSCDSQLLSMIVEKASGKSLAEYASEKLWIPLGAERDALWSLDQENGSEKAYCCFNSNARDFARIGQMVLDSGQFNGKQLVSKEYIRQATTPDTWLKDEKGNTCNWYGYQFWTLTYKGMKVNFARGILGQYIFMIPDKKAVIVRLGHKRSTEKKGEIPLDVFMFLDAGLSIL